MLGRLATFALLLALPAWASAAPVSPSGAEEAPVALTLAAAMHHARAHQPTLAAARARLTAAEREAEVPGTDWAPRIGAMAQVVASTVNNSTASLLNDPAVPVARVGASHFAGTGSPADWRPYPTTMVGVGVRQEIYDFGRIAARSATLAALADVERARTRATQLDLDFSVAESFYAVLAAHGVLEAASLAESRSRSQRDFAESAVRAGLRDPIERTRADADLARFEVGRVRAARGLRIARIGLAAAIGSPQTEVDAVQPTDDLQATPTGDDAVKRALASDPALLALQSQVRAEALQARAITALLRPDLYASGSFSMRAGAGPASGPALPTYGGWLPEVPNYHLGVVLSVPLFDASIRKRAAAATARARALDADGEAQRIRVQQAARQAVETVHQTEEALGALERAAVAARANADQAEARFRNGLGTSTERADAEALRAEAEVQLTIGRFQHRVARSALARRIAEEP